jgi:hypothetical protein
MKKLLFFAAAIGLLALTGWSQLESLERKGERRFEVLSRPAKEIVVGVCWPWMRSTPSTWPADTPFA